jgi:hypothetical protein
MFLNVCLTLEEFARHRNDSPSAVKESLLGVGEGAPSGLHRVASDPDQATDADPTRQASDPRSVNSAGTGD